MLIIITIQDLKNPMILFSVFPNQLLSGYAIARKHEKIPELLFLRNTTKIFSVNRKVYFLYTALSLYAADRFVLGETKALFY